MLRKNSLGFQMQKKGSILILTLSVLAVLAVLSVNLSFAVRQKLLFMQQMNNRDKLHFIAEAGIKKAIIKLRENNSDLEDFRSLNDSLYNNPLAFQDIQLDDGVFNVEYDCRDGCGNIIKDEAINDGAEIVAFPVRYGIMDEESKININTAGEEVIKRLIQSVLSLDDDSATELAYCIIDWRDEDSNYQDPRYGAEDDYYENLKHPYKAKNAEYEILDELLMVKGMNIDFLDKLRPYLTVFGEGQVNINTASEEVLSALGLTDALVSKILSFRYGADLEEFTLDDNVFASSDVISELKKVVPLDLSEIGQLKLLISEDKITTIPQNFIIKSIARLDNKNISHRIIAIVDTEGEIKYWQEE